MSALLTAWLYALLSGVRHATEPDHVAAVSTLLAEQPASRRGAALGALWGVGHTASLLLVGAALLALHLRMPGAIDAGFELVVATMLLALGLRSLWLAWRLGRRGAAAAPEHHHDHGPHAHHARVEPTEDARAGAAASARRPLLVGMVHGLAGSGAATAFALANMPSLGTGLVYMAVFGAGSVVGMALLAGLAGLPLRRLAARVGVQVALRVLAGVVSLALGVLWGAPRVHELLGR